MMPSSKIIFILAILLVDLTSCTEKVDALPQGLHLRAKRNWPFDSSRGNAQIINDYYQAKPDDGFYTRYIEKPFARYVGRAAGDEFPAVRDSIIDYQNRGYTFGEAHRLDTGYHPDNWKQYNWNNDRDEANDPYDPFGAD